MKNFHFLNTYFGIFKTKYSTNIIKNIYITKFFIYNFFNKKYLVPNIAIYHTILQPSYPNYYRLVFGNGDLVGHHWSLMEDWIAFTFLWFLVHLFRNMALSCRWKNTSFLLTLKSYFDVYGRLWILKRDTL